MCAYWAPGVDHLGTHGRRAFAEELRAMELLWNDLRERAEAQVSPAWHGDELAQREHALSAGHETAEDWDAAKRCIRDDLACGITRPPRADPTTSSRAPAPQVAAVPGPRAGLR